MEKESFITAGLLVLTLAALAGWFFMARRPGRWTALVERENNFWRDKGLISAALAEKLKRLETGKFVRFLCLVTACIAIIGVAITLSVWVKAIELRRHKFPPLYNPAVMRPKMPAHRVPPKK